MLANVLARQLELRYEAARPAGEGLSGRFELRLTDPEAMWSVEPGTPAPSHFSLVARDGELSVRAGACLDPDAVLTLSVADCTALVAGRRPV